MIIADEHVENIARFIVLLEIILRLENQDIPKVLAKLWFSVSITKEELEIILTVLSELLETFTNSMSSDTRPWIAKPMDEELLRSLQSVWKRWLSECNASFSSVAAIQLGELCFPSSPSADTYVQSAIIDTNSLVDSIVQDEWDADAKNERRNELLNLIRGKGFGFDENSLANPIYTTASAADALTLLIASPKFCSNDCGSRITEDLLLCLSKLLQPFAAVIKNTQYMFSFAVGDPISLLVSQLPSEMQFSAMIFGLTTYESAGLFNILIASRPYLERDGNIVVDIKQQITAASDAQTQTQFIHKEFGCVCCFFLSL